MYKYGIIPKLPRWLSLNPSLTCMYCHLTCHTSLTLHVTNYLGSLSVTESDSPEGSFLVVEIVPEYTVRGMTKREDCYNTVQSLVDGGRFARQPPHITLTMMIGRLYRWIGSNTTLL